MSSNRRQDPQGSGQDSAADQIVPSQTAENEGERIYITAPRRFYHQLGYSGQFGVPAVRARQFLRRSVPLHVLAILAMEKDYSVRYDTSHEQLVECILRSYTNANLLLAKDYILLQHLNAALPEPVRDRRVAAETLLDLWSRHLDVYWAHYAPGIEL